MRYHCKVFSSRMTSLPEVCGEHASYWDDFTPEEMAGQLAATYDVSPEQALTDVRQLLQTWDEDGLIA